MPFIRASALAAVPSSSNDRRAPQRAALVRPERLPRVLQNEVVPDHQIATLPAVDIGQVVRMGRRELPQFFGESPALLVRQAVEADGADAVVPKRFPTALRIRPDERLPGPRRV